MMPKNERTDCVQGTSLDEDLMAGWEESLQTLFQSLLKDWENPQQAKKSEDLDIFMVKWVEGAQAIFGLRRYFLQEKRRAKTAFRVKI